MRKVVFLFFVVNVIVVRGELVKDNVETGDCVCASTNVHARSEGSISGSILTTIGSGNCGKIYGGIITKDGYTWYEIKYNEQRVWVAGNYLIASEKSKCEVASGQCPPIIKPSQWGARKSKFITYLNNPVKYAFIHHAASADCHDEASCARLVRSFQNLHMDERGWSDIAYTFLIGGDGSVFEGRGWDRAGGHTKGYNSVSYAICFIGNFVSRTPTAIQLQRAKELLACGVAQGKFQQNYILRGHRDVASTACPGDILYNMIKSWPHY